MYPVKAVPKGNGGEEGDRDEVNVAAHPGGLAQVGQHEGGVGHECKAGAHWILAKMSDVCIAAQQFKLI